MPIEADILLAQGAYDSGGGVSALAVGWQIRPPEPGPWALVLVLRFPRDQIGTEHQLRVTLETEGGAPVEIDGEQVAVQNAVSVEGRADLDSPIVHSLGLSLLPLPLPPGQEFRFRLWVDGETRDHWIAHFRTTGEDD